VVVATERAGVAGGGGELPLNETINATAAATTRAATTATEPISQRSGPADR
jgi:hypothetical protein